MTVKNKELYAVFAPRGASELLKDELSELGIKSESKEEWWCKCEMTLTQKDQLIKSSLLATKLVMLMVETSNLEEIKKFASELKPEGTFSVRAIGEDRQEIQEEIGAVIHTSSGAKVNLSKPQVPYYVIETGTGYLLGIDQAGELGKRHYKIITGAQSLAGPVAASILRFSGWNPIKQPKKNLLVWPCATGELAIEAALWASGKSPRAYELREHEFKEPKCEIVAADSRLAMVNSTQKNSKIAGVHSFLRFSRQDLDWLDTKHDEKGVDYLVGLLPNLNLNPGFAKELYYQLDYILAKGGVACFACVNEDSAAKIETGVQKADRNYEIRRECVFSGQAAVTLVILTSKNEKKKKEKSEEK